MKEAAGWRQMVKATPKENKFRLPHGAKLEAGFDGEKKEWFVTLVADGRAVSEARGGLHDAIARVGRKWIEQATK